MTLFVVLLGAPGVGKGTQADLLSEKLGLPHISSGNLFREAIAAQSPLGQEAQAYIERGELVPDATTIAMVAERLGNPDCALGAIFDGFPRTVEQAKGLDRVLAERGSCVDFAVYIRASIGTLLRRLTGRWTCKNCQAVYHELYNPPRVRGRCDVCGGGLYQRVDDRHEAQQRRIDVYSKQTTPLVRYYQRQGVLVEVDGEGDIANVHAELLAALRPATERESAPPRRTGGGRVKRASRSSEGEP